MNRRTVTKTRFASLSAAILIALSALLGIACSDDPPPLDYSEAPTATPLTSEPELTLTATPAEPDPQATMDDLLGLLSQLPATPTVTPSAGMTAIMAMATPEPTPTATPSIGQALLPTTTALPPAPATTATPAGANAGTPGPTPTPNRAFPTPNVPDHLATPPLPPNLDEPTPTPTPKPMQETYHINLPPTDPIAQQVWFQDGLTEAEYEFVQTVRQLDLNSDYRSTYWLQQPAFITIEPRDRHAVQALHAVRRNNPLAFWTAMKHDTVAQGIVDRWVNVITALPVATELPGSPSVDPRIVNHLLTPAQVSLETATHTTPLGQDLEISIVRTAAGDANSMTRIKHAIDQVETFKATPFPAQHLAALFIHWPRDAELGGQYRQHAVAISRRFDVGYGNPDSDHADTVLFNTLLNVYQPEPLDAADDGASGDIPAPTTTPGPDNPGSPDTTATPPPPAGASP